MKALLRPAIEQGVRWLFRVDVYPDAFERLALADRQSRLRRCFQHKVPDELQRHPLLFIHVPKNGGTSIKRAIYTADPGHATIRYYDWLVPALRARAVSFAVMREPIDRFLSGFDFLMNGGGSDVSIQPAALRRFAGVRSIDDYLDHLEGVRGDWLKVDSFARPQWWFVTDRTGAIMVDHLWIIGQHEAALNAFLSDHGFAAPRHANRTRRNQRTLTSGAGSAGAARLRRRCRAVRGGQGHARRGPGYAATRAGHVIIAVIVASLGRPQALAELLEDLALQSRVPDRIILSLTTAEDAPEGVPAYSNVEIIYGPKGSCAQRNTALDHLGATADVILFLDDDYVPSRFAVERAAALIETHPEVAGATGRLLADGVQGPGIGTAEARRMLAGHDGGPAPATMVSHDLGGLYGCNMVFRAGAIRDIRFDERLPLYGWQEDIDFAARARPSGRIVQTYAFAGVHRGVKTSRTSGVRIGYSQVVNPAYLVRKGTMGARYARKIVLRNVAANHARALRPEPWVDRIGRVRGNWLGIVDLLLGRARPERILEL